MTVAKPVGEAFQVTTKCQLYLVTGELRSRLFFSDRYVVRTYVWIDSWVLKSAIKVDAGDLGQLIHILVQLRNSGSNMQDLKVVPK